MLLGDAIFYNYLSLKIGFKKFINESLKNVSSVIWVSIFLNPLVSRILTLFYCYVSLILSYSKPFEINFSDLDGEWWFNHKKSFEINVNISLTYVIFVKLSVF